MILSDTIWPWPKEERTKEQVITMFFLKKAEGFQLDKILTDVETVTGYAKAALLE